ncbi:hypothetical protein CC1G_11673 [Coprinopsis cinerea okayama7|uniref:Cytochrome P450 n=1 Tax=Coprinopsis cinerea (strain Okayama-7 / 130 / ATCC MYA-4618 / FGSC 9003) TaxID=240176 RepID=A8P3T3_COPC7|nr:hypothetical protein CC1G_11673 [Coprinopsis cinerea okayama7\|eukprot:XP_001838611.2 hypothetical protein CC1G_11673 [Coprinopsis cinerea okayama7\
MSPKLFSLWCQTSDGPLCTELHTFLVISLFNWASLLLYWLILLTLTLTGHSRGNPVWTRSVKDASFFSHLPSAPNNVAFGAMKIDSPIPAPVPTLSGDPVVTPPLGQSGNGVSMAPVEVAEFVARRSNWLKKAIKSPSRPGPPGPKGYPIIGNVLDIPTENITTGYQELTRKYGDLIYLEALGQPMLILSSLKRVKELFDERSAIYSDRPPFHMMTL